MTFKVIVAGRNNRLELRVFSDTFYENDRRDLEMNIFFSFFAACYE